MLNTGHRIIGIRWLHDYWYLAGGDIVQDFGGYLFMHKNSTGRPYYYRIGYHPLKDFAVELGLGLLYKVTPSLAVDLRFDRLFIIDEFPKYSEDGRTWDMYQTLSLRAGITIMMPFEK